jgi:hypothetical protein
VGAPAVPLPAEEVIADLAPVGNAVNQYACHGLNNQRWILA